MNLSEHPILKPHLGKQAILDSNLLLLRWCSSFNPDSVTTFKHLNSFQVEDIELLSEVLRIFSAIQTTPHVLTEVSNLTNHLPSWVKNTWYAFFAHQVALIPEICEPSADISSDPVAIRFGLTDAALVRLAATHVVLTIDWPLTSLLESRKLHVINFNHLREAELYS